MAILSPIRSAVMLKVGYLVDTDLTKRPWVVVMVNFTEATIVRLCDGARTHIAPTTMPAFGLELTDAEMDRKEELVAMGDVAGMPTGGKRGKGKGTAKEAKGATKTAPKKAEAATNECPLTGGSTKGMFAGPGSDAKAKSILNKVLRGDMSLKDMDAAVHDEKRFRSAILKAKKEGLDGKDEKITKPTPYFE